VNRLLPEAIKHGWLKKLSIIQVGWHSYSKIGSGARTWQLFEIRQMLSETHTMDLAFSIWFGPMVDQTLVGSTLA